MATNNIPAVDAFKPGVRATGFAVLVGLRPKETVTAGGIVLPDTVSDRERLGEVRGRVVSVSPAAFDFADFGDDHAHVGDVVIFARHAGTIVQGDDGLEYRLLNDRDIWGIVEERDDA